MPSNAVSGCSCFINLLRAGEDLFTPATRLPCTEYRTETVRNATTGAVQEIATIESQGACRFEIHLTITPDAYSLLSASTSDLRHAIGVHRPDYIYKIILDGLSVGQGSVPRNTLPCTSYASDILSWDSATVRHLQFAPVDLVDPDEHMHAEDPADRICEDEKVIKSLGMIRIDFYRCLLASRPRPQQDLSVPVRTSNQMKFSERSKKAALSNTAGLAPSVPNPRPRTSTIWTVEHCDPNPFLEFVFQYKPRSILERDGIIPQTVQPAESSSRPKMNVIEIKSESETEEEDMDKRGKRKAKPIKTEAKKPKTTDQKPLPAGKETKPIPKSNFLDLAGSDDD
ncbi:hypothetical protein PCASD_13783 [Puccinia coronata f. sp. avenae]|nr:hypothetical protein PCASD_13783 [Puccinia coronata f. sp. avenae]